mmetsp:Transcript_49625/g.91594  ORF Transcript_49625/g.91594 Transcript_49625/m.91594 type:complete len:374 (-) Transcript_49625:135-1256(-)
MPKATRTRSTSSDSARDIINFDKVGEAESGTKTADLQQDGYRPVARTLSAASTSKNSGSRETKEHDGESEIQDLMGLSPSIYDLTVQLSCIASHESGGRWAWLNLVMVLALQVLNVWVQLKLLIEVSTLIAQPAVLRLRSMYEDFTQSCGIIDVHWSEARVLDTFRKWNSEQEKEELCRFPQTEPFFFFLVVFIWTMYLCYEIKQTCQLSWTVLMLDRPNGKAVTIWECDGNYIITKMGLVLKVWLSITVFIPKLVIGLILWYIGAEWLTATPGVDNLMLNSLALAFICEVDELIFRTCMSQVAKFSLERTKLPLPSFTYTPTVWGPAEMAATSTLCIWIAYFYVYHFQQAIPDYRWDLEVVCDFYRKVTQWA